MHMWNMAGPTGFYGVEALKACKFSRRLHDIMTDDSIISKFHWMSHMGAAARWDCWSGRYSSVFDLLSGEGKMGSRDGELGFRSERVVLCVLKR